MKFPDKTITSAALLQQRIDTYFEYIEGEYYEQPKSPKEPETLVKVYTRIAEPPIITGLAFHLGFDSRQSFDDYLRKGKYAPKLKRASLRVEAEYEKKLHQQAPTGAIFALKNLGWNEKTDKDTATPLNANMKVVLLETGPKLATSEKEVML